MIVDESFLHGRVTASAYRLKNAELSQWAFGLEFANEKNAVRPEYSNLEDASYEVMSESVLLGALLWKSVDLVPVAPGKNTDPSIVSEGQLLFEIPQEHLAFAERLEQFENITIPFLEKIDSPVDFTSYLAPVGSWLSGRARVRVASDDFDVIVLGCQFYDELVRRRTTAFESEWRKRERLLVTSNG